VCPSVNRFSDLVGAPGRLGWFLIRISRPRLRVLMNALYRQYCWARLVEMRKLELQNGAMS
jgi:hypothetical protein